MRRGFLPAAVVVLILAALGVYWQSRQLYVVVVNASGEALKNVSVSYSGGSMLTGRLEPGEKRRERIRPTGDGDLEVVVWDKDTVRHEKMGNVYFEVGTCRGTFTVTVCEGYVIEVTSDLR